jgi:type I restriction enzyme S subunit
MIDELRPYPRIKDSGVTWLGEIPEHWDVMPICALARRRQQTNEPQRELLSVYLGRGVVPFSSVDEKRTNPTSEDLSKYQAVEPGDFVLNNQQAWRGSVGVSRYQGIVSPAYLVLALDGRLKQEYADRLLSTLPMVTQYLVSSKGVGSIQRNLYWPHLRRVAILVPPTTEQAAIVRFLCHADRKIRRYIRAKQKLIKLLEEQKQAIIHRAVTRGLDPNIRLKPSGVEWLGDVPEHWEVKRAKTLFHEVDHRSTTGTEELLSLRMYQGLVPHSEVSSILISSSALVGFKKVRPGQLVMNRMRAAIGMFGIANRAGLVSPDYAVLEPIDTQVLEYFLRLFKTCAAGGIFRIESKGLGTGSAGFMRLYTDRFGIIKLPVPPVDEQQQIVQEISDGIAETERTGDRLKRETELLYEYRTRLIADVVTGKLDVREAAAGLPEEIEPLANEDLDDEIEDLEHEEDEMSELP